MAKLFRSESVRKITEEKKTWLQDCYGKQKELKPSFKTLSGIPMKALYTPDDCASMDYLSDLGFPGLEPFIRGVYPTMYRGRTWTQRQLAGYGPPEETNKRY
ncbi:MAG: methylmalonyl-CoA mutase, partial [Syntrophaceae bacterium]|nr:methylmalonyl-CoA mutase [Syntrophaceae bacterium]